MLNKFELIFKIAKNPKEFLIDKSINCLEAFLIGVDSGLAFHEKEPINNIIDRQFLNEWIFKEFIVSEEHSNRMNAFNCMSLQSYCELMTSGEEEAFDLYIKSCKEAYLAKPQSNIQAKNTTLPQRNFFEFIEFVKKRPGMYVRGWDIKIYENIAQGYIYAEEHILKIHSELNNELTGFKDWLDKRYPYGTGVCFSKIIEFTAVGQRLSDIEYFEEHLDMFRKKESPNAPDRTNELMVKNILEHAQKQDE